MLEDLRGSSTHLTMRISERNLPLVSSHGTPSTKAFVRALQAQRLRYSHLSSLSLSLLTLFNKGRVLFFQRLIKIRLVTPTCSAPLSCFCLPPPLETNSYSDIAVASLHLMVAPYSRTQTTTSIAYITFFSDVEHEVSEVTSGHRVTITYNLYFDVTKGAPVTQYNCVHSRSN
jgi:hypothetical protein